MNLTKIKERLQYTLYFFNLSKMSLEGKHVSSTDLSRILNSVEVHQIGRGTSSLRHGGTVSFNPDRNAKVMRRVTTAEEGDKAAELIERRMQNRQRMEEVIKERKKIPAKDAWLMESINRRIRTYKTALELIENGRIDEGSDLLQELFDNLRVAYQKGYIDDSFFLLLKDRRKQLREVLAGEEGSLWDQMIYEKAINDEVN